MNWIKSFLKARKKKVMINGEGSVWSDVLSGIPRGSVLGPALFLVFINDLPDFIANFVKIFADDTKVYTSISTISDNDCNKLKGYLTKSSYWSDIWDLRINANECKS